MASPEYSIVIPVYGSAPVLPELHRRITEVMHRVGDEYEIIFINDCSPDDAWSTLETLSDSDPRVTAIQLMRNSGQGAATMCGLAHAAGRYVITMDDDLQHPPEEIRVLIQAVTSDPRLDVVMGKPREKQHHPIRRLGSRVIHEINSILLGKPRHLYFTSFRILRREVVDVLLDLRTMHPALGPMISSVTRNIANVPVEHAPRKAGKSGYSLTRIAKQLMGNFVGYSVLPLHAVGIIGLAGIVVSIVLSLVFLTRYLAGGITVPGWTTIVLLLLMLSGVTFFCFAVLGEYLLKILQLGNALPTYVVRTVRCGSATSAHAGTMQAMETQLTDGVVYLRALAKNDLNRTLKWMNRPDIRSAIDIHVTVTRESQDRWFEGLQGANDKVVYAICLVDGDQHIGNVSMDQMDPHHRHARLSIFLADEGKRGQGIGTRAMRLLMKDAFEQRGLRKLWCKTTAGDPQVLSFYERLGFSLEGTFRAHEIIDGRPVDKHLLGMLRSEWRNDSA